MTKRQLAQLRASVITGVQRYYQNPDDFDSEQIYRLQRYARALGINFEPRFNLGRAIGKGLFELADTAALGLLPNSWSPRALTSGERFAGTIGDVAGLFTTPFMVGGKIAEYAAKTFKGLKEANLGTKMYGKIFREAEEAGKAAEEAGMVARPGSSVGVAEESGVNRIVRQVEEEVRAAREARKAAEETKNIKNWGTTIDNYLGKMNEFEIPGTEKTIGGLLGQLYENQKAMKLLRYGVTGYGTYMANDFFGGGYEDDNINLADPRQMQYGAR